MRVFGQGGWRGCRCVEQRMAFHPRGYGRTGEACVRSYFQFLKTKFWERQLPGRFPGEGESTENGSAEARELGKSYGGKRGLARGRRNDRERRPEDGGPRREARERRPENGDPRTDSPPFQKHSVS